MEDETLKLAKQLIAIPSMTDSPDALGQAWGVIEKKLGGKFPIQRFEKNGVKSYLVSNVNHERKDFTILLNGHLDVIYHTAEHFNPTVKKGRLYGRGAYDMKAAMAVKTILFASIAKELPYPIGFQITTDEETGGANGTVHQVAQGVRGTFILTGEGGTNMHIKHKAKGIYHIKLRARGIATHGAYPWRGKNAVMIMQETLLKLHTIFPTPTKEEWKSTVSVTRMDSEGVAINKIPDVSIAYLDVRFIQEDEKTILKKIKGALSKEVTMSIVHNSSHYFTPPDHPHIRTLRTHIHARTRKHPKVIGAHGSSDLRHFPQDTFAGVEFGPIGSGHHAENEWVDIKSLEDYYHILKNFLLSV